MAEITVIDTDDGGWDVVPVTPETRVYYNNFPTVEVPNETEQWIMRVAEEWGLVQEYLGLRMQEYYEERRKR